MEHNTEGRPSFLIGLTGTYCAGKNHVAALLERRGLPALDVDKLGHQVLELEREALWNRFGAGVFRADGSVDRRILGERVFGNREDLAALEGIVHPRVNQLTGAWIAAQGGRPCVINAALLHRSVCFGDLAAIILVKAPLLTRLLRARKRDGLSWGELARRFGSQRQFTAQYLSKRADIYIIYNRGYSSLGSRFFKGSLEARLDRILSRTGIGRIGDK